MTIFWNASPEVVCDYCAAKRAPIKSHKLLDENVRTLSVYDSDLPTGWIAHDGGHYCCREHADADAKADDADVDHDDA